MYELAPRPQEVRWEKGEERASERCDTCKGTRELDRVGLDLS